MKEKKVTKPTKYNAAFFELWADRLLERTDMQGIVIELNISLASARRLRHIAKQLYPDKIPEKVISTKRLNKTMPTHDDIDADLRVKELFTSDVMKQALKDSNKQNTVIKRTLQAKLYGQEVKALKRK